MDAIMVLFKLYFGAVLGMALGNLIWGTAEFVQPTRHAQAGLPGWR